MNKTQFVVGMSLAIFFLTVLSLVGSGLWVMKQQDKKVQEKISNVNNNTSSDSVGEVATNTEILTIDEVTQHKTPEDCWIIIANKVYGVSSYLVAHPGGAKVIVPYCGGDATNAFATKDKGAGADHSKMAHEMLVAYYLGTIGEKKTELAVVQPTLASGQPTPTLRPGQPTPTLPVVVPTIKPVATANTSVTLTAGEVASHNTLANCWMIISGKVYDVTSYVYQHPGGASVIAPYCGKDGSNAFATKNTGSSHSSYANNLLNNFLVGNLGSAIVIPTVNPVVPTPTSVPGVQPTSTLVPTQPGGGGSGTNPTPTNAPQNLNLSSAEVATHSTLQNCWMIVSNKVYNVTSYVYQHPGGANAIAPYCGKDGTQAFATRGGSGSHSNYANNLLNNYLIGTLNSTIPVVPTNTPIPGVPTNTPAPGVPTNTPIPSSGSDLPAAITSKYPGATRRSGGYEDNGSWEGKINTSSGQCREMKVNSSGSISEDKSC